MFQGQFLAQDIRVADGGKPILVIHIESIAAEDITNHWDLTPPADAFRISSGKIAIPEETMKVLVLRQVMPHYPYDAKAAHISGIVDLQITIGKYGRVTNAQAVSGPFELRKAAIDAGLKWENGPFLVAGEPTEVETSLQLTFTVGG